MSIEREYPTDTSTSENNPTARVREPRPSGGRYLNDTAAPKRRRSRRRKRKLNPRFVIMLAVLLFLLIGIAIGIRSCTKPTIKGRWDLDGTTIYEFGKDGRGALVLMTKEYEFSYKIEGDMIYIDFTDEMALDAKYTFEVKDKMLFMTGGPGDARSDYVLQRLK